MTQAHFTSSSSSSCKFSNGSNREMLIKLCGFEENKEKILSDCELQRKFKSLIEQELSTDFLAKGFLEGKFDTKEVESRHVSLSVRRF